MTFVRKETMEGICALQIILLNQFMNSVILQEQ